jgi:hypothetical protein
MDRRTKIIERLEEQKRLLRMPLKQPAPARIIRPLAGAFVQPRP